ncbi:hypothetical protein CCP3SC1_530002 [Gammaproteobacteria bacterium]
MTKQENHTTSDQKAVLTVQNTLPDIDRRKLLKRLSAAAVVVPVVTVLHDATKNNAHACP